MTTTSIELYELPLPAIETYRTTAVYRRGPMLSLDLEIEFDETSDAEIAAPPAPRPSFPSPPPSDRFLRTRTWTSEDLERA